MNKSTLDKFKIYIYGMGEYGIDIFLRLRDIGIEVKAFIDNNDMKHSRNLYQTPCVSLQSISIKEDIIIIVGLRDSDSVIENLIKLGIKRVYSYQEVRSQIEDIWLHNLLGVQKASINEIESFRNILMKQSNNINKEFSNIILLETYEEIIKQRIR